MAIRYRMPCLLAAIASLAALAPATAGDVSTLNILGFSEDGTLFAFEEYGVQDGSGFPYARRFYIDTSNDSYAASPVRVLLQDEAATVAQARAQAREQGQSVIADAELAQNPGYQAGFSPVTELSSDPHRMTVNPRPVFPPIDPPLEVRLTELRFPVPENCAGITETHAGFRLTAIDPAPGGRTILLHEDKSVPASRGCPLGYRIGGIQTYYPANGARVTATLLAVESFGFEGPDYHWMAVTATGTAQGQ